MTGHFVDVWEDEGGSIATALAIRSTGRFEILVGHFGARSDRDFKVGVESGRDAAAKRVAALNTAVERDNPREYRAGRRYYHRRAPG